MDIKTFIKEDLIVLDMSFNSKEEALKHFAQVLEERNYAKDAKKVHELALKREGEFSTGIGGKIAIPHIRDNVMNKSVILFARVKPLDWQSLDNQDVEYIFFIALNASDSQDHMTIISSLSTLFLDEKFVASLKKVKNDKDLIKLMNTNLQSNNNEEQENSDHYDIVAVTACPTGIAHTFMARDMLSKAAKEMNVKIKIETQGAEGVKNQLTQDDINNAKGIILACDRVVDLSRFSGQENVLELGTKAVIKDAKKEITRSLNGEGVKFEGKKTTSSSSEANDNELSFNNFGKRMYRSLMTGVSYMLPFVVFGGILIAIAFLIDMANAGSSDFGSVNPVAKWFKGLGGLAFGLMIPVLASYIAFAIVGRIGLLPGFVVGMMAKGDFFFNLNPKTGQINWLEIGSANGGANSGVFGAIIGAFLAASILIALSKYVFSYLPQSINGVKNILIIPLVGTFVIAAVFYIVNIPIIYLNYGFTEFLNLMEGKQYLAWLLGMILGAMMAVDLGGPINKAAYVFGTASLDAAKENNGDPATMSMAAAMVGGMTPPLAIALSCTFFKKYWTKDERNAGMLNYIMGATFISEGAIPFTAAKPKLIVPANIVAGAVGGLVVGILNIKIAAPHGGILVIALAKSSIGGLTGGAAIGLGIAFFLAALAAGSIAGMFTIMVLHKIYENKKDNPNHVSLIDKFKKIKKDTKKSPTLKISNNKENDLYNNIFTINRLRYKY